MTRALNPVFQGVSFQDPWIARQTPFASRANRTWCTPWLWPESQGVRGGTQARTCMAAPAPAWMSSSKTELSPPPAETPLTEEVEDPVDPQLQDQTAVCPERASSRQAAVHLCPSFAAC